jgi:hypothetical protein
LGEAFIQTPVEATMAPIFAAQNHFVLIAALSDN